MPTGVAIEHWACTIQHPPRQGFKKGQEHSVGCAVTPGHDLDYLPSRCRVCVRKYRPPVSDHRVWGSKYHYSCPLERWEHDQPLPKYSKTGHLDSCGTNLGHSGRLGQSCSGCRAVYRGVFTPPTGRVQNDPHWDCDLPLEAHPPIVMFGQGHRAGCGVAEGHDFGVWMKKCHACRKTRQQGNIKSARMKKVYGLPRDQYDQMLAEQGGRCAICGAEPDPTSPARLAHALHVDHDHATNKIRGLLCYQCNLALGNFRDNETFLLAAVEYLRGHGHPATSEVSD
jgi:hypothetical protein